MKLEEWLSTLPLRLRALFRREQMEQDLKDELQDHLDQLVDENLGKGMSPEEARYAATRAMGPMAQVEQHAATRAVRA